MKSTEGVIQASSREEFSEGKSGVGRVADLGVVRVKLNDVGGLEVVGEGLRGFQRIGGQRQ